MVGDQEIHRLLPQGSHHLGGYLMTNPGGPDQLMGIAQRQTAHIPISRLIPGYRGGKLFQRRGDGAFRHPIGRVPRPTALLARKPTMHIAVDKEKGVGADGVEPPTLGGHAPCVRQAR